MSWNGGTFWNCPMREDAMNKQAQRSNLFSRLVGELHAQFVESAKLEQAIKVILRGLGYGG